MENTIVLPPFPTDLFDAIHYYCDLGMCLSPVKLTTTKEGLAKQPLCTWSNISTDDAELGHLFMRSRQGAPFNVTSGLALGLDCGKSGIFVLDVDMKMSKTFPEGAPGKESLAAQQSW
jgi:hypothetical protein